MNHPAPQPNPEEIFNLAALSALDAQDDNEQQQVEEDLAEALVQEIAGFEDAVSAISYSVPIMPMSPDLKDRLFQRITPATSFQASELYALMSTPIDELIEWSKSMDWQAVPNSDEFSYAIYETHELHREFALFVKSDQPGLFPRHHHASGEEILVLAGDVVVDDHVYQRGDHIISAADTIHQPATRTGCLLFCIASMDNQFVT